MQKIRLNLQNLLYALKLCCAMSWASSKFYTIFRVVIRLIHPVLLLGLTYLSKYVLDVLSGGGDKRYIYFLLVGAAFAGLVYKMLDHFQEYLTNMHTQKLSSHIQCMLMEKAQKVDLSFYDNPDYYNGFQMAQGDLHVLADVLWNIIYFFSSCFSFLIAAVVLLNANPLYCILLIVVSIPDSIMAYRFTKSIYHLTVEQANETRRQDYLYQISTSRGYAQEVRLYQIGNRLKEKYTFIWNRLFESRKKLMKKRTGYIELFAVLPEIIGVIILIQVVEGSMRGIFTVGDYSLYSSMITQLTSALYALTGSFRSVYDNALRIKNFQKFETLKNEIRDEGTLELKEVKSIEFQNVTFLYPNAEEEVLDEVSFQIQEGEKVAFVGVNGAGKSTIIKLLLRFYDVTAGKILINGKEIKEYTLISLRRMFSCYFQSANTYGFSLRENITIGNVEKEEDETEIRKILENCNAEDILRSAEDDLDIPITKSFYWEGLELSGGQYQKLALARTFYRDAQVIILDEPSSALDPEAEHHLFCSIEKVCSGKTTILTSHRLSNIYIADKIILLENGRVLAQGPHNELLENSDRYAVLFHYQADKYMEC